MPVPTRTSRVRFTIDSLGLVDASNPRRFVERVARRGEEGDLIVEGDLPIDVPEGWVVVGVGDGLYAPVHPEMIEPVS